MTKSSTQSLHRARRRATRSPARRGRRTNAPTTTLGLFLARYPVILRVDIARACGRSESWVSRVVAGEIRMTVDDLAQIADYVGERIGRRVRIAELIG